jgi:hypothetical protein
MSPELIDEIVKIEVVIAAVPGLLFVLLYQLRYPWYKSSMGRHVMAFMSALEFILLLAALNVAWPEMPGKPYLRMIVWAIIIFIFSWRTAVLIWPEKYADEEE